MSHLPPIIASSPVIKVDPDGRMIAQNKSGGRPQSVIRDWFIAECHDPAFITSSTATIYDTIATSPTKIIYDTIASSPTNTIATLPTTTIYRMS